MEKTLWNRRGFLKAAALVGVGGTFAGLTACAPSSTSQPEEDSADKTDQQDTIEITRTESFDIVVCGAGASGITAAVHAAESGARVALLEKAGEVGGSSLSVVSALVRNPDDDLTEEVNEWVADSHWRVNAEAIYTLLRNSGTAFSWLQDNHGWELTQNGGMWALPGTIQTRKDVRTELYQNMITSSGVSLFTNMTAKQLILDESGAIAGVIALDSDGNGVQFDCKALTIATGGYAANREMVKEAFGFDGICDGLPQNIGEGLEMAWNIGAKKPINFGGQMLHQTLTPCTDSLLEQFDEFPARYPFFTAYLPHFMNVTEKGRRFRNEDLVNIPDAAANSSAFQGAFHYVVVSKTQLDKLAEGGMAALGVTANPPIPPRFLPANFSIETPWSDPLPVFEAAANGENGFMGNTFQELAEAAGMDPATFETECKNYEQYCASGNDSQLGKRPESLIPLEEGPYFLIKAEQNNLTSWGGLATDAQYRVYDNDDNPIPGLWAVGIEAGSNLYNDTYVGNGVGICLAVTSGFLTGGAMAEFVA
ncbi:FAD-dependent oxidoreductase [Eggerthella sp. YY7918]|uniref:FAD-dependent oxidoreductase n=1 Tax=Eggerthella sp. (strain YY7918) TaxID=502558 RepID=UPI0002170E8A|nr:FAD-dependent oxidoreductase [Eggerthella sp. YY7918]BAK43564.1 succinate dehydrogenase [Eggerthella sp. YY7918]